MAFSDRVLRNTACNAGAGFRCPSGSRCDQYPKGARPFSLKINHLARQLASNSHSGSHLQPWNGFVGFDIRYLSACEVKPSYFGL